MNMSTKIIPAVLVAVLSVGFASSARADRDICPAVPAEQWMSIEAAIQKAEALGYSVRETKRSKGCWKVEGFDRNGAEIELRLHPVSGEVVRKPNK